FSQYPELPPAMRGGLRGAMRCFGPGAIVAAVSIGSGETLFASRSGALFGYGLIWFIVICVACKLVQVYGGARYMVLAGEHPMQAWARLPGPRAWFPVILGVLSVLCFPFWMGGLAKILGTAANWIIGIHPTDPRQEVYAALFGTGTLVLVVGLTLWQSYAVLEKAQTIIVAVLLASILAAVAAAPVDWAAALRGAFTVGGLAYPDWVRTEYPKVWAEPVILTLVTFMGAIGGGTQDYIGYLGFFREKSWGALGWPAGRDGGPRVDPSPANVAVGRRWLRAPIIDVFTGFVCVLLFTLVFNLLGAAILHPDHKVPEKFALLSHQVEFLARLGLVFAVLYKLGIITAFWANIYGAQEVYSRTAYECLLAVWPSARQVPFARVRLATCLYSGLGGIALMWTVAEPVSIVKPAAVVGTLTCGLWCFATIWADRRFLPAGLRMNGAWVVLNVLAGGTLVVFGGRAVLDYLKSAGAG
ncbi:MAG: Nramp family divalent metal transporter, partial [Phycisphaerae bacterium]